MLSVGRDYLAVRIVDSLGEAVLLSESDPRKKQTVGRHGIRDGVRSALQFVANQGLSFDGQTKANTYKPLRPIQPEEGAQCTLPIPVQMEGAPNRFS